MSLGHKQGTSSGEASREWISPNEASELVGLSRVTLWRITAPKGPVRAARVGRAVRINRRSLIEFMESREREPEGASV